MNLWRSASKWSLWFLMQPVIRVLLPFHFLWFEVYFWDDAFYKNWSCEGLMGIRLVWINLPCGSHSRDISRTKLLLLLFLRGTLCIWGSDDTWNEVLSPNRRDKLPSIRFSQVTHPCWAQIWSSLKHLQLMVWHICSKSSMEYFLHF